MTLNITVVTRDCIYQSADYRLTDQKTNQTIDFETQKIVLVNTFGWTASVCFAGRGRTHDLDVSDWLVEHINSIQPDDPFERLLDELLQANDWLSSLSGDRRHTFSVGAFVGSQPMFALVSNFEQPSGYTALNASTSLSVFEVRPTKPTIFLSGQKRAVTRDERRWLIRLATKNPEPQRMYSALAEVNRRAATRTNEVSSACFTAYVRLTGEGGGHIHDMGDRPFLPKFAIPAPAREAITQLLDQQIGSGRARFVGMSTGRVDSSSEEYHKIQLREKPNDPITYTNYGVFLKERKSDLEGAERAYRKALELNPNHVSAIGNLANLLREKGEKDQALDLYNSALESDPGNENVTWNFARFLNSELNDTIAAREMLDHGITIHPQSGRLLLLRAELSLLNGDPVMALEDFRRAREQRSDQAAVEAGYACALHLSGAPIGECISAYRTAIALRPEDGALKLNLAQLLFIKGNEMEANRNLQEAIRLGLDESAQLEAQFYLLAYTSNNPIEIFRTTKTLLSRGGRLRWNVQPNIEQIKRHDPRRSDLLAIIATIMAGDLAQDQLDRILLRWS